VLPAGADDPADPFSHPSGLAPFQAAACRLAAAGVRCPEVLFTDSSRALYPADIAVVEDVTGGSLFAGTCVSAMLDRALAEMREIAGRDQRAADAQRHIREALHALAEPLEPRAAAALVHGELGPDHVFLDRRGDPVLIDIEGTMYFDAEWSTPGRV
jgi:hypothetical protein